MGAGRGGCILPRHEDILEVMKAFGAHLWNWHWGYGDLKARAGSLQTF